VTTPEFRASVVRWLREQQDRICAELEQLEGPTGARFVEDEWTRAGGGGGRTRVLTDGVVFEKGGVNFSEVHGEFSESFAEQIPGSGRAFWASGVSLVLHPRSPHVPTVHANFRHIVHGDRAWFGGGADLTPYYFHAEDRDHFHDVWREVCERHGDVANHPTFSDACDRYFYLPHRGERRGVGGIFFDYLWVHENERRRTQVEAFVRDAASSFVSSYAPIVERRRDQAVSEEQRRWQELRRGRYVEFNLVYDRGTVFGLKTGGRTESILMSLPPRVRWDYAFEPAAGSDEAVLLEILRQPPPSEPGS
jgi:coproporphyrinogen III oxidase